MKEEKINHKFNLKVIVKFLSGASVNWMNEAKFNLKLNLKVLMKLSEEHLSDDVARTVNIKQMICAAVLSIKPSKNLLCLSHISQYINILTHYGLWCHVSMIHLNSFKMETVRSKGAGVNCYIYEHLCSDIYILSSLLLFLLSSDTKGLN